MRPVIISGKYEKIKKRTALPRETDVFHGFCPFFYGITWVWMGFKTEILGLNTK